jgi:hypothetical protein
MKRSTPLKRTPFKPRSVLTRSLRPESKRTHAKMRTRRKIIAELRAENRWCRFCGLIEGAHCHEPWSRGRGGPIDDRRNLLLLCPPCHAMVHENPKWSAENGLLVSAADGPDWLARGGCLHRQAVRQ